MSKLKLSISKRHFLMLGISLLALLADILTKVWANNALEPHIRQVFIPPLLNLILVNNTGLAFSMASENKILANIIASAVFGILLYFYCRRYLLAPSTEDHPWLEQLGVSIIIGAAAGNLFERFIYGHVTDFLEFAFITFPVFNLADVLIDLGVGLVFISIYRAKKQI